jgi:hypothetical protein
MSIVQFSVWDSTDCLWVHEASLALLEDPGVEVKYGPAVEVFAEFGRPYRGDADEDRRGRRRPGSVVGPAAGDRVVPGSHVLAYPVAGSLLLRPRLRLPLHHRSGDARKLRAEDVRPAGPIS